MASKPNVEHMWRTWIFSAGIMASLLAVGIDLNTLFDYDRQPIPTYILKDNTPPFNDITNEAATLGRVLFYDTKLSLNGTVSCGSCHKQEFAFGDTAIQSIGLAGGKTGRHSMRLVNTRFGGERRFFWDERAVTLETQTTMPIQDHVEMGFSGAGGDPDIDSLIRRLETVDYYQALFTLAFGDAVITEDRIQRALSQFIRSIQSFDAKYDEGRAMVNADTDPFPNFTNQENLGKALFLNPPPAGGAGCQGCHRAPEFDIDPNSLNNGIIGVAGGGGTDLTVTRAPSLRDLVNPAGQPNGPFMHTGSLATLLEVIDHYNRIPPNPANTNLDPRLAGPPGGQGQNLQLSPQEKSALEAFLRTLTGTAIYTAEQWSNPFDANGVLDWTPLVTGITASRTADVHAFPNPAATSFALSGVSEPVHLLVYGINGQLMVSLPTYTVGQTIDVQSWPAGMYLIQAEGMATGELHRLRLVKQ